MEVTPKKCQVVMKKIDLGERAMHRCVVPIKRLKFGDRKASKVRRVDRILSPIQCHKLTVLLQKLNNDRLGKPVLVANELECSKRGMSPIHVRRFRVLLRKLKLKDDRPEGSGIAGKVQSPAGTLSRIQVQKLHVLLRKLKLDNNRHCRPLVVSDSLGGREETLSKVQLQNLRVLLKKLELSKKEPGESVIVEDGKVSKVRLQKLNILLRKLNKDRLNKSLVVMDGARGTPTCPPSCHHPPLSNRQKYRVLLTKLKLNCEIREQLDPTIFIDQKLGFVTNPYLIPGFHRSRLLNSSRVKVLKFGRRSHASRCRVRIRKLQL